MRAYAVIGITILAVWAGTAWAEEAPPPPAVQAAEPDSAPSPLTAQDVSKRERIWNSIITLLYSKDADREELRRFLSRYLEFFPQPDDPHREVALYLIEQLDAGVAVKTLRFQRPKPPPEPIPLNGYDILPLRLHLGQAIGLEIGAIGFRQGYFVADPFHFTLLCPYGPALFTDLGTSLGARFPLGKLGRDELRLLAGVSWIGFTIAHQDSDGEGPNSKFQGSDLGVSAEFSYVHRYSKRLALEAGIKGVLATITIRGYFNITGFVGLRF